MMIDASRRYFIALRVLSLRSRAKPTCSSTAAQGTLSFSSSSFAFSIFVRAPCRVPNFRLRPIFSGQAPEAAKSKAGKGAAGDPHSGRVCTGAKAAAQLLCRAQRASGSNHRRLRRHSSSATAAQSVSCLFPLRRRHPSGHPWPRARTRPYLALPVLAGSAAFGTGASQSATTSVPAYSESLMEQRGPRQI